MGKKAYQSNFCLIWLLDYHFVQLEELRMIICIRDVSLLNQHWASVRQLTGEALIGLKAHLVWFILNILYASQTLCCKRKDIKSSSFFLQSGLSVSLHVLFLFSLLFLFFFLFTLLSSSTFNFLLYRPLFFSLLYQYSIELVFVPLYLRTLQ